MAKQGNVEELYLKSMFQGLPPKKAAEDTTPTDGGGERAEEKAKPEAKAEEKGTAAEKVPAEKPKARKPKVQAAEKAAGEKAAEKAPAAETVPAKANEEAERFLTFSIRVPEKYVGQMEEIAVRRKREDRQNQKAGRGYTRQTFIIEAIVEKLEREL